MDVGLEPGFLSHVISLALTWNRVSPDALRKEKRLDGDIGWSTELLADGEEPVRYLGPTLRLNVYEQDPYR